MLGFMIKIVNWKLMDYKVQGWDEVINFVSIYCCSCTIIKARISIKKIQLSSTKHFSERKGGLNCQGYVLMARGSQNTSIFVL